MECARSVRVEIAEEVLPEFNVVLIVLLVRFMSIGGRLFHILGDDCNKNV